jgi:hypothetical protein
MKYIVALTILFTLITTSLAGTRLPVLSNGNLADWEDKRFSGETSYTPDEIDGQNCVKAVARGTASGMFREMEVDLTKTPYLNWRWRVDNIYDNNGEQTREGDDYPARIYVVKSGGVVFWKTLAVNYVWSSHQAVSTSWFNAYTGNAHMFAVRSGQSQTGRWLAEKRNVRDDFRQAFGKDITTVHAVAFMSDADNTGQRASACYGDIFFSGE